MAVKMLVFFSEQLAKDIDESYIKFVDRKMSSLARSQNPKLIDELRKLAERRWSAAQFEKLTEKWRGTTPFEVLASLSAEQLLFDAQQEYFTACKEQFGECPERECKRPLVPHRLGDHGDWVHCPYHAATHYGTTDVPMPKKVTSFGMVNY